MTMEIVTIDTPRAHAPRVTAFTRPFWDGVAAGRFSTTRCVACARLSFPPKPICPHCWTPEVVWETLAPAGRLYSWTRIHAGPAVFAAQLPYEVGVVDLDDGIRIGCRLWSPDKADWRCDMRVDLVTLTAPDGPAFAATPARTSDSPAE